MLHGLLLSESARCLDLPKEMGRETAECVRCHREHTPGVVYDWARSRHAWTRPEAALEKPLIARRISAARVPDSFKGRVVGCFECHGQNPDAHPETFSHMGFRIHTLVTPLDCEACHPTEVGEYSKSRKALSYARALKSPLGAAVADALVGSRVWNGERVVKGEAGKEVLAQQCWGCHGAPLALQGARNTTTALGEIGVAALANWPNQGIGRVNPDGTFGTCSACHGRHAFAVEDARHPETCARCHTGGHSPAWEAYSGSAHGGLYRAREPEFDWGNVPWVVGQDFSVPTCAACHVSQVVNGRGVPIVPRSHDFGSRVWSRLLSLPDAGAPSEAGADTSAVDDGPDGPTRSGNAGGREGAMGPFCAACHGRQLPEAHFSALDATTHETAAVADAAAALVQRGWRLGVGGGKGLFKEPLEELWLEVWFLDVTAARYAAAMGGPPGLRGAHGGRASANRALDAMERQLPAGRLRSER